MEIKGMLERRQRIAAFAVSAMLIFVLHQVKGIVDYPYDSTVYWNLSKTSFITNFPDIVRGYVYPLLIWPFHGLGDVLGYPNLAFRVGSSLVYAYLLSGPVANVFLRIFGGRLSFLRRLALVVAVAATYPGLFLYPLSDLPAVLLVVLSLSYALGAKASRRPWLFALASGAAAYAAYNTRTIYLFSLIAVLLMLPLVVHRGDTAKNRSLSVVCFLLGAGALALPQMLINKKFHDIYSPAVLAVVHGKSLMATQLFWGVTIQRYETSINPDAPAPSFYFKDPAGMALRALHPGPFDDASIPAYIGFVAQHPIQFMGIYGRHVINGLDVRDGIVYARRPSQNRNGVALGCVAALFLSFVICLSRRRRWEELVLLSPVLISVLAIIPGAVETRFFVPVYLVVYAAAATQFEAGVAKDVVRRHGFALIVGFAALASLSLAITSSAMASLSYSLP